MKGVTNPNAMNSAQQAIYNFYASSTPNAYQQAINNFIQNPANMEVYKKSGLTIIPLKNSYQPSGQSVTLQSMAVGTPVMITKTDGFWDLNSFANNKICYNR